MKLGCKACQGIPSFGRQDHDDDDDVDDEFNDDFGEDDDDDDYNDCGDYPLESTGWIEFQIYNVFQSKSRYNVKFGKIP